MRFDLSSLVAHIDLPGAIRSLNVSNATALALHVAAMKLGGGSENRQGFWRLRGA